MADFAKFKNLSNVEIHLHLDWDGGGFLNTIVKPGETAEIGGFNGRTATICHRSDGGNYNACPAMSRVAKSGDSFALLKNGGYAT